MKNPFPQVLYVSEPLSDKDPFEGYTEWDDCEPDDIIATYQLVKVFRVKETREKSLEEYDYDS